jgi:Putative Ig domain
VHWRAASCGILLVFLTAAGIVQTQASQSNQPSLQIFATPPQNIIARENFNFALVAQGGFPPYTWHRVEGDLPPGLKLYPHKGAISGVPTAPGEYHFALAVADSNIPRQEVQRNFTITVIPG